MADICSFTGHRPHSMRLPHDETSPAVAALKRDMERSIDRLITENGVTRFVVGLALGADCWCAEMVLARMEKYPALELEVAIPFVDQIEKWPKNLATRYGDRYAAILQSGKVIQNYIPDAVYQKDSYRRRNQYLIDVCQYLLAVWNGSNSGTGMTVQMARNANKICITINPLDYRHLVNTEKI